MTTTRILEVKNAHRHVTLVGAIALVIALGACGGGSKSSVTASPTTADRAPAADIARAKAAMVTADDVGAAWVKDNDGEEGKPLAADDCRTKTPLAETALGAVQGGPTLHVKDTKVYIFSTGIAFADVATAKRYTASRASKDGIECTRVNLDAEQRAANATFSVRTGEKKFANTANPKWEAYSYFQAQFDDGSGVKDANGVFIRAVDRVGATVLVVGLNRVASDTDPANLEAIIDTGFKKAVSTVFARMSATDSR